MITKFIKALAIIFGSMLLLTLIILGIIGLFAQEISSIPLEEFSDETTLQQNIHLDPTTTYNVQFPSYIPSYFREPNYVETDRYLFESSIEKYYAIVELFDVKEKKFTHSGYTILFSSKINKKDSVLDFVEEKLVVSSIFDKKQSESILDRHIDDGGIATVFNDTSIIDKEQENNMLIANHQVRYFVKDGQGESDITQLTAYFKTNNGIYKIYFEISYSLSGKRLDWCFEQLELIIQGLS